MAGLRSKPHPYEVALGELDAQRSPGQRQAFAAFARTGLPSRQVEAWKYSDLAAKLPREAKDLTQYLRDGGVAAAPVATVPLGCFASLGALELVFVDGHLVEMPDLLPQGLEIGTDPAPDALAAFDTFPMAGFAAALSRDPELLVLRVHNTVDRPVWLRFIASERPLWARRVRIVLEAASHLALFESHERLVDPARIEPGQDQPGSALFGNVLIEISMAENSNLSRWQVQDGEGEIRIATTLAFLAEQSRFVSHALTFGGGLVRLENGVRVEGRGANAIIRGTYALSQGRHADLTQHVRHAARDTSSDERFRGVVDAGGDGVFQGKILVAEGAQKTDAQMRHDALLLEEGAQVHAKPELEIYADDVQCAHGNTIGALDEAALFYMRSRGIPESQARSMLIRAFLLESLPDAEWIGTEMDARSLAVLSVLERQIDEWLARRAGLPPGEIVSQSDMVSEDDS